MICLHSPVYFWISHAWSSFHPLVCLRCSRGFGSYRFLSVPVLCSISLHQETVKLEGSAWQAVRPSERKHASGQGKCFGEKGNRHSELWGLLSGLGLRSLVLLFVQGSQRSGSHSGGRLCVGTLRFFWVFFSAGSPLHIHLYLSSHSWGLVGELFSRNCSHIRNNRFAKLSEKYFNS